jgi:glycosyltransferase involved in cell wall biosynthesis
MMRVSVVIPTYNRPELLSKALDSVCSQDYRDIEVIVVDDGLDMRADEVVAMRNDARIRYVQHAKSMGAPAARNHGVRVATGALVAFLDDDDSWLPGKLSLQVQALQDAGEGVGFCFGSVIKAFDTHEEATVAAQGVADYADLALRRFNGFMTSTLLVRKSVFEEIGGFDESFPSHQEAELMIRLSRACLGVGIREPLARMSISESRPHIGGDITRRIAGREMLLDKHKIIYQQQPRILALHQYRLAFMYRDAGDRKKALVAFRRAWSLDMRPQYLLRLCVYALIGR